MRPHFLGWGSGLLSGKASLFPAPPHKRPSPKSTQQQHRGINNHFLLLSLVGHPECGVRGMLLETGNTQEGKLHPIHNAHWFSPSGLRLRLPSPVECKLAQVPELARLCQKRRAQPPLLLTGLLILVQQVTDVSTFHFHPTILLHVVHCGQMRKNRESPFTPASSCSWRYVEGDNNILPNIFSTHT